MPAAIDATVGGAASNSYITVAEGDTFADDVLGNVAWSAATADDKARALLVATARLDELAWVGSRTDTTTPQALAWPRSGASCGEKSYADDVIPDEVKTGTFDLANLLLSDTTSDPVLHGGAGQRGAGARHQQSGAEVGEPWPVCPVPRVQGQQQCPQREERPQCAAEPCHPVWVPVPDGAGFDST